MGAVGEIQIVDGEWQINPPAGKSVRITTSGGGKVYLDGAGKQKIGTTADILYGGDMTSDTAGMGVRVISADGDNHFAHAVYADDAGVELAAGWVSSIFGSMKIYTAVTPSVNLSAFGLTGQLHLAASVTSSGNLCGVYGVAETVSGVTITSAPFFGGLFGFTLPSGATNTGYMGGVIISGNIAGTTTGAVVPIYVQNPSAGLFDAFVAIGQNGAGVNTGCVDDGTTAGDQCVGHLKIMLAGTVRYINIFSDNS